MPAAGSAINLSRQSEGLRSELEAFETVWDVVELKGRGEVDTCDRRNETEALLLPSGVGEGVRNCEARDGPAERCRRDCQLYLGYGSQATAAHHRQHGTIRDEIPVSVCNLAGIAALSNKAAHKRRQQTAAARAHGGGRGNVHPALKRRSWRV